MKEEPKVFVGVDWGTGGEKNVGVVVMSDGVQVGELESFELTDREVASLQALEAPRDFCIPAESTGELGLRAIRFNLPLFRQMLYEPPYRLRNPPVWELRRWWTWTLQKSNRSFRSTALSQIRRLWRRHAWDPSRRRLQDYRFPRFRIIEDQSLDNLKDVEDDVFLSHLQDSYVR